MTDPEHRPRATPLDRIDANFYLANGAFIATSETGEVLEARDVYITNTGLALGDFNIVFPKRPGHEVEEALDRGARYFESKALPYRVCVRADCAELFRGPLSARGFQETPPVPGMTLSPIPDVPEAPGGLEIRRVEDPATLADFQKTAFAGFGLPTGAAPLFLTEQFLELPQVSLFVGYAAGEPVATSALVVTAQVAGIYWVATLDDHRGRGYGAALTWRAVGAGAELGCSLASLQASELGRPVYARMGFAHDRDYAQFDSPTQKI